jgi:flotillin
MNSISFLALLNANASPALPVLVAMCGMFVVVFIFMAIWANRYTKVGPDEVLIVSGRRYISRDSAGKTQITGFRMLKGGGTFVLPVVETAKALSLKPVPLDLAFSKLPARDGRAVDVRAKAQVRINSDAASLAKAAESLLGKSPDEVKELSGQILESSLRRLIGERTAGEIVQTQNGLAVQWQASASATLAGLGLEILSLSTRDVAISDRACT